MSLDIFLQKDFVKAGMNYTKFRKYLKSRADHPERYSKKDIEQAYEGCNLVLEYYNSCDGWIITRKSQNPMDALWVGVRTEPLQRLSFRLFCAIPRHGVEQK